MVHVPFAAQRSRLAVAIDRELGPFDRRYLEALIAVPRERFVHPEDEERSAQDMPLPLDADGLATISAPHAYLLSFRLLALGEGDNLLEFGAGSGYGAALAATIVGASGRVVTVEIDPGLAAWARRTLADRPNVEVVEGDAAPIGATAHGFPKIVVTFAIAELPAAWLDALPDGGRLVAPVGGRDQKLVLATKRHGAVAQTSHGTVRYVKNRSGS
jgi:protein-L-isoaspartate(D-aspartate) O-methyltransferase